MSTPMLKQYHEIKAQYPDTVLFFRMGDFFELFFDDAKLASDVLGLTLTKRNHGKEGDVPLAGFPHHQLEQYLSKMTRAGHRVAVCEQVEDPKKAKGLVKRAVTEVVSAGTTFSENALEETRNNYLAAVVLEDDGAGLAYADVTTGEFFTGVLPIGELTTRLSALEPSEFLFAADQKTDLQPHVERLKTALTPLPRWQFTLEASSRTLSEHFGVSTLRGFGLSGLDLAVGAAGALVHYLRTSLVDKSPVLPDLQVFNTARELILDPATRRHLELVESLSGDPGCTLFHVINRTRTGPGARLLRRWLLAPLTDRNLILERQSRVAYLVENPSLLGLLSDWLAGTGDLQRLLARLSAQRASPRDAALLRAVLEKLPRVQEICQLHHESPLQVLIDELQPQTDLVAFLRSVLVDEPPLTAGDGRTVRAGFSPELDELRDVKKHASRWILDHQQEQRSKTGIPSLKIGYNKVFGYYIEITHSHKDKVPADYIRKQTLTGAERYVTPELKSWEEKILTAEEKIDQLETEIWQRVREEIVSQAESITRVARGLAELDATVSLARIARERNFIRPRVNTDHCLAIKAGRHPVVESLLPAGVSFVPNDLEIGTDDFQIMILTGPNMAGKSTYLRQAALIVILAQMGSYVPAESCSIGLVDRIFTRIGAGDNLAAGESTFLVEMTEVANILRHATPHSLVILDEVGRGTSTYDGLSLAWAITEYLHENPSVAAKTLFATHYHELNHMASQYPHIRNFRVEVEEWGDRIVFQHRITRGETDRSYGVEVARLAGLPSAVVDRARQLLPTWGNHSQGTLTSELPTPTAPAIQLTLFESKTQVLADALLELDMEQLSPREALNKLFEFKEILTNPELGKRRKKS
ncbi:MAG: DNA mismatch repair protein MutS [Calditrichota bacterium]